MPGVKFSDQQLLFQTRPDLPFLALARKKATTYFTAFLTKMECSEVWCSPGLIYQTTRRSQQRKVSYLVMRQAVESFVHNSSISNPP